MHFYLKLLRVMMFWPSFLAGKTCLTEMIWWVRVVFFGVSYHAIHSCSLLNVVLKPPIAKMTLSKCISSSVFYIFCYVWANILGRANKHLVNYNTAQITFRDRNDLLPVNIQNIFNQRDVGCSLRRNENFKVN